MTDASRRSIPRHFLRALRLRCPHCGGGPAFVRWLRMLPACTRCGIRFERGERGYWLGAYLANCIAVMVVFTAWWTGVLTATWPDIPWAFLHVTTFAWMLGTPFVFYPFSKTLFLAFDLLVRPPEPEDFRLPEERSPSARRPSR
jgi:uncharacterized protein (DUF983 family)